MVSKNKIILMTRMAIYDKRYAEADREVFAFFRRDYIYRKNMWTRLCVAIGSIILLALYWLHQIFIYGVDLQELDIQQSVLDSVLFLIAMMAVYTLIGTIQGTHQYHVVQTRMERYLAMLQRLERIPDSSPPNEPEDPSLVYTAKQKRQRRRA